MSRPFNEERTVFSINSVGKTWISTHERMKLGPYLTPYIKIISNGSKNLYVRAKSIKLLEENIEENLHDVGFGNDISGMSPKAQATKKLELIKIKTFVSNDTNNRVKRQPMRWEKIFANHIPDK